MEGDDFIITRKSRRVKKPTFKKYLDDSDGSGDDFALPSLKKTREEKSSIDTPKPTRLSREEKQFNWTMEKVLAESERMNGPAVTGSEQLDSSSNSVEHPADLSDDNSDFEPETSKENVTDSDDDFEPSSPPTKKTKKVAGKKATTAKKVSNNRKSVNQKKESAVTNTTSKPQISVKSRPDLPKSVAVRPANLPGAKPSSIGSTNNTSNSRETHRPKWVPPTKIGSGDNAVKSPCTCVGGTAPPIRIGLSRKARIKPLHKIPLQTKNQIT